MSGITGGARLNAPPAEDTVNDQRASRDISARRDFKTPHVADRPRGVGRPRPISKAQRLLASLS